MATKIQFCESGQHFTLHGDIADYMLIVLGLLAFTHETPEDVNEQMRSVGVDPAAAVRETTEDAHRLGSSMAAAYDINETLHGRRVPRTIAEAGAMLRETMAQQAPGGIVS